MAKKHRGRPALNAAAVWRWIVNGILEIEPVRRTPAFILTKGKSVRQRWVRRRRGQIETATAVTYLRLGTFLVPRWFAVPNWRVAHLKERGLDNRIHGYATFKGQLKELCYMQVDDLDHCMRQQVYVLEGYEHPGKPIMSDFMALMDRLARIEAITGHIASRKAGVDSLHTLTLARLRSLRRSLSSIVVNAPTFQGDTDEKKRQTVLAALEKVSRECGAIAMRPLGRRARRASRSLRRAVEHIRTGRLKLARVRIISAYNNLAYPLSEEKILDRLKRI
ncbi:MAG: hypothetical protein ABSE91_00590 [Patescibacteria group bacterium]|jgi:hypothetical protein